MHLFILLSTLWVMNISVPNTSTLPKRNDGLDERFEIHYDEDKEVIYSLQKHYYNMELLRKLQMPVSFEEKIEAIQNNAYVPSYYLYDVKSGGLMSDWECEDF